MEDWGLAEVIKYGRGVTLLFHGPAGTGKTLVARKLAEALGFKLVELDTAMLESAEPGQFERNLKAYFEAAGEDGKTVLFIDECDGLIQSRQGMGQIMSGQSNALLKCIEAYEGVLIMATNRVDSLDEALERRISMIIEIPRPTPATRKKIWKYHLPKKLPLGAGVDIADLAQYDLSGGQIKNVVINAARYAIADEAEEVNEVHFKRAVVRALEGAKVFSTPRQTGHRQQGYIVK